MALNVITSVGTSLITNYIKYYNEYLNNLGFEEIDDSFREIEDKTISENDEYKDEYKSEIKNIKEQLKGWILKIKCIQWDDKENRDVEEINEKGYINKEACAELTSLIKFCELKKEDIEVYLMASDSISSHIISELLAETLDGYKVENCTIKVNYNEKNDCIKGLNINDEIIFKKEGISSIISRYQSVWENSYQNTYFNITGGYKGVIPIITLMGQVFDFTIFYSFENTNRIIEMPKIPMKYDDQFFNKFYNEFIEIEIEGGIDKKLARYDFLNDENVKTCLSEEDGLVTLSEIGFMLWDKYKSKFVTFYCPDDVYEDINSDKQKKVLDIILENSSNKELWDSHIKSEDTHKTVYKRGNNEERIYYFYNNNLLYIYKTFGVGQHDEHEKYINSVEFNESFKEEIIRNSKFRREYRKGEIY